MPRFMGFVRMEENIGEPPQSLFGAMDAYIGERVADGVFIDGAGSTGPRTPSTSSSARATVADQEEFARLHAEHWPEVTVVATLRQVSGGPETPEA